MKTVNDFAFYLATFSLQNVTGLIAGLDGKIRGQYPFQPIKFVNLVVPSPCETEPYNNNFYCYTSQLKYVFRLEENVLRVVDQNSLAPWAGLSESRSTLTQG